MSAVEGGCRNVDGVDNEEAAAAGPTRGDDQLDRIEEEPKSTPATEILVEERTKRPGHD